MASDSFRSITIKGFKSIRSIEDLYLRPINLLIGANGSGKSNFLETFILLGAANAGELDSYVLRYGGANKLLHFGSKTTQEIYILLASSDGCNLIAHCVFTDNDSLAAIVTKGGSWGGIVPEVPSFNRYRFQDTGEDSPLKKTNELHNNRSLTRLGGNLAAFLYLLRQRYRESYERIRQTVQQVAPFFNDFQLSPLALNQDTIKLEWKHRNSDQYFDASSFSDGTLRFIALATLFLQPVELRPAVILVDEPELGMHPYAIELLASLMRQASKETQVIAATQSSLLLDYFEPEDVLVADRVNGATELKRLQREPLAEWLKEYSLGQLWEKGEFAGRPVKE
ncbi:MAG TPA: AAA family ATPase [Terracidiphilus sp.]|nr:AAA family ATPase [Terracidiphilus sp.]